MKNYVKRFVLLLAAVLMMGCAATALAKGEPISKTIEQSHTYDYGTLKITVDQWRHEFKKTDLRYFVAHVYTTRPEQLRTAFAGEKYSKDLAEAPKDIAARHDAVLAINGDYYNYKENSGLIIRNGELYRELGTSRHQLLIYKDGTMKGLMPEGYEKGKGQTYIDRGVEQCFTFGPLLVHDHQALELPEKYYIATYDDIREPRTAIGQVDENHYVIVVADGRRKDWSDEGMTLPELQQIFVEQGARIAYNLDGGGSTTMVLEGERVNKGSTSRERDVSDIIYFTK